MKTVLHDAAGRPETMKMARVLPRALGGAPRERRLPAGMRCPPSGQGGEDAGIGATRQGRMLGFAELSPTYGIAAPGGRVLFRRHKQRTRVIFEAGFSII